MSVFRYLFYRAQSTPVCQRLRLEKAIIFIIIVLCLGFVLFHSKQVFYYQYDPEYQENLYYHSQWNYPGSRRGISDGEIYKFVGYRLVQGENPFNINYEIPPLGKYLYGVSIHLFGNPYWLSLALYFSSIVLIYLLSKHLFKNTFYSFLVVLLFVTTPFSATEIRETMLDLPLMTFYLAHVFFFTLYLNSKRLHYFLISGILLGLATGIKPGVYTLFVTVLGMGLVYLTGVGLNKSRFEKSIGKYIIAIKKKISKKRNVILNISKVTTPSVYALSVFAGYVLSYFSYFIRHPNPIPWLRLHEKPLHFYLGPESNVDRLNVLKSIFLNRYQGWWQKEPTAFGDWSLILPLGVIAAVIVFVVSFRSKNRQWLYLSGLTLLFLSVNSFIPFFPRYLMPAIPLFILLIVRIFKKMPYVLIILSFANIPFLVGSIATKEPKGDMQAVARFISTRAYRELYRSMDTSQRSTIPETEFIDTLEYVFESLGTREINVNLGDMKKEGGRIIFPSSVKYITKYGEINFSPEFEFIYKKNEWKFVWKWEYLLEGYTLGDEIVVDEEEMVVSRIMDRNGTTLAQRGDWKTVYVITRVMFDWSYHLNAISSVTGDPEGLIDERVRRVIPDHFHRFVGYLDPAIDDAEKKAEEIPGVSLKDAQYLTPVNRDNGEEISDMIRKLYNNRPELFYVRAVVNIKNSDGKSVPLKFDNVESKDVVLEL